MSEDCPHAENPNIGAYVKHGIAILKGDPVLKISAHVMIQDDGLVAYQAMDLDTVLELSELHVTRLQSQLLTKLAVVPLVGTGSVCLARLYLYVGNTLLREPR